MKVYRLVISGLFKEEKLYANRDQAVNHINEYIAKQFRTKFNITTLSLKDFHAEIHELELEGSPYK